MVAGTKIVLSDSILSPISERKPANCSFIGHVIMQLPQGSSRDERMNEECARYPSAYIENNK